MPITWALILATARRMTEVWLHAGQWSGWKLKQFLGTDVHRATLGIMGMGRIGQAVVRRARGLDMTVLYHNTYRLSEEVEKSCRAAYGSMDKLLARAEILTLRMPYSPARAVHGDSGIGHVLAVYVAIHRLVVAAFAVQVSNRAPL